MCKICNNKHKKHKGFLIREGPDILVFYCIRCNYKRGGEINGNI